MSAEMRLWFALIVFSKSNLKFRVLGKARDDVRYSMPGNNTEKHQAEIICEIYHLL